MSDDITLERFEKKGGRWAYQLDDTPSLYINQSRPGGQYTGRLSAEARRLLDDPGYVNVYVGNGEPVLAFEPTDDPDKNAYKVGGSGAISLSSILKQGLGIHPEGRWHIEGDHDDDRGLLLFDLTPVVEAADG